MNFMSVSKIEQETVILFNEAEPTASVYTYNGALKRKLSGLCEARPTEARQIKDDERGGLTFEVPKRWIKVNASIVLTEEQRQARTEAARARFSLKKRNLLMKTTLPALAIYFHVQTYI